MGLPSWLETSRKHAKALIDDACCRPKRESSKGGPKYEEGESDSTKEGSNEEDLRGHGVQVPLSDGNSLAVNSPEQDAEDEPVLKSENKFGGHSQELMDAKVDVTRTDGDETPLNKLVAPIASVDGDDSRKGMDSDGLGHFGTIVSDTAATAEANSDMQPSISSNDDHLSDKIATANSAQPIDNDSDNEASVPASVPDAPAEERNSDGEALANSFSSIDDNAFPMMGVRLSFFRHFIETCRGTDALRGLTTDDVCHQFVKAQTAASQLSLCEQLSRSAVESKYIASPPNWFVSHAWKYQFLDVVEALELFLSDQDDAESTVLWFDLFSNSQHNTASRPFEWWTGTFMNAIKKIGRVVMIMQPWEDPIPLRRAWCVFELHACVETKSEFHVAFTAKEKQKYLVQLVSDPGAFFKVLATVKSENSEAFNPADKASIHDIIRKTITFTTMDAQMFSVFKRWMLTSVREVANDTEDVPDEIRLRLKISLSRLLFEQGAVDSAEEAAEECLKAHRELLGNEHENTLTAMNNLASIGEFRGKYEKSLSLYTECLELQRKHKGDSNINTLTLLHNIASLYQSKGMYDEALTRYLDCLQGMRESPELGENHPTTLQCENSLASLYVLQGKIDEGRYLHESCLAKQRMVLGNDHADTLASICNVADIYKTKGNLDEAEKLFNEYLEAARRTLGADHSRTLVVLHNLASIYNGQKRHEAALVLLIDCVEAKRRVMGNDNPSTLNSIHDLSGTLFRTGEVGQAFQLLQECVSTAESVLGEDHPSTQAYKMSHFMLLKRTGMLE